jgi:hypothetical protein
MAHLGRRAAKQSVVVTTRAMHMAMFEFDLLGLTYTHDLDIEIQLDSGQRMIGIDLDRLLIGIDNRDSNHLAIGPLGMEHHTRIDLFTFGKHFARYIFNTIVIAQAVGLFRWHLDLHLVTNRLAGQGVFQSGNDILRAMQVDEAAVQRLVDDVAGIILEGENPALHE